MECTISGTRHDTLAVKPTGKQNIGVELKTYASLYQRDWELEHKDAQESQGQQPAHTYYSHH